MNRRLTLLTAALIGNLIVAGELIAQPVIDGTVDAAYGAALSVQNTQTQFGDSVLGDLVATSGGSEIDQVFAMAQGGRLYVAVAGNLGEQFQRLEVFVDSALGGIGTVQGSTLPAGVDPFCCGGLGASDGALQRMTGLTFDASFSADYYLSFSHGGMQVGESLSFWGLDAHYANLREGTSGRVVRAGMQLAPKGLPNVLRAGGETGTFADLPFVPSAATVASVSTSSAIGPTLPGLSQGELIDKHYAMSAGNCQDAGGAGCLAPELELALPVDFAQDASNSRMHRDYDNFVDLRMALDNSNTSGVAAGSGVVGNAEDPQNVSTGLEFSLPLWAIGNPSGPVKLTIFLNGPGHDFVSNQFAGAGVLQGNFGNLPPNLELEAAGMQFVTVSIPAITPGDYNDDDIVNIADYTVWRDNVGAPAGTLINDPNPGAIGVAQYTTWKANFGDTSSPPAAFKATTVPEPCSVALMSLVLVLTLAGPRRR